MKRSEHEYQIRLSERQRASMLDYCDHSNGHTVWLRDYVDPIAVKAGLPNEVALKLLNKCGRSHPVIEQMYRQPFDERKVWDRNHLLLELLADIESNSR